MVLSDVDVFPCVHLLSVNCFSIKLSIKFIVLLEDNFICDVAGFIIGCTIVLVAFNPVISSDCCLLHFNISITEQKQSIAVE